MQLSMHMCRLCLPVHWDAVDSPPGHLGKEQCQSFSSVFSLATGQHLMYAYQHVLCR